MPVSLDLRKAWKYHRTGDLIVVLTWVNDERSLVLMPALRRNAGWVIIGDSAAWKWAVDHEDRATRTQAQHHALVESHKICDQLNLEPSRMNRARVISIITGWIPDLIRMPSAPEPEFNPESYGQLLLRADGKPIAAEEVRTQVEGVTYG